jgi:hypothetical protein
MLVQTGLDLFDKGGSHNFATIIFYQTGYDLFTLRQAARRAWRIGQKLKCKVVFFFYKNTMQERAMTLMGRKLKSSEAIEGKFSAEGLASMSGESDTIEVELARSLVNRLDDFNADREWEKVESGHYIQDEGESSVSFDDIVMDIFSIDPENGLVTNGSKNLDQMDLF